MKVARPWTRPSPSLFRRRAAVLHPAQHAGSHSSGASRRVAPIWSKSIVSWRRAMSYDLDQFVADCRAILARDPGPDGREEVRVALERLLSNKDFVEEYCGAGVPR